MTWLKTLTSKQQTSLLFTSVVKELNLEPTEDYQGTNPAGGISRLQIRRSFILCACLRLILRGTLNPFDSQE